MSEIKTVTHDGKVYQVGENYLFSDNGTDFSLAKLVGIKKTDWPFKTNDGDVFKYIHEASALENIGTITPAPIELVDGAPYMFNIYDNTYVGLYKSQIKAFCRESNNSSKIAFANDCTNIRLMTVESK
jgi:hypothetical protein